MVWEAMREAAAAPALVHLQGVPCAPGGDAGIKALAIADGAAYDAPVSGGCSELISHS